MADLVTTANIDRPDDFYAELIEAHASLSKAASDAFNARLILILMNHIGDRETIRQALRAASLADAPKEAHS